MVDVVVVHLLLKRLNAACELPGSGTIAAQIMIPRAGIEKPDQYLIAGRPFCERVDIVAEPPELHDLFLTGIIQPGVSPVKDAHVCEDRGGRPRKENAQDQGPCHSGASPHNHGSNDALSSFHHLPHPFRARCGSRQAFRALPRQNAHAQTPALKRPSSSPLPCGTPHCLNRIRPSRSPGAWPSLSPPSPHLHASRSSRGPWPHPRNRHAHPRCSVHKDRTVSRIRVRWNPGQ